MLTNMVLSFYINQVPADAELSHRGKLSQSLSTGSLAERGDSKPENSHLRHTTSMDLMHMSRVQRDTVSPSYPSPMTSPMALSQKPDLSLQKGPPAFLSTPPPATPPSSSLHPRPDTKLEHSGHRSIDMVQLLTVRVRERMAISLKTYSTFHHFSVENGGKNRSNQPTSLSLMQKYPIVWQGLLALKNDQAAVQLHFVSGNNVLAQRSLPPPDGGPLLRIAQRMRLEASQLDSVARRMTVSALPS